MSYFSIKVSYALYIFKLFKNYIHVFRSMTIKNFLWRTLSLAYSSFGVNSLAYAFVTLKESYLLANAAENGTTSRCANKNTGNTFSNSI